MSSPRPITEETNLEEKEVELQVVHEAPSTGLRYRTPSIIILPAEMEELRIMVSEERWMDIVAALEKDPSLKLSLRTLLGEMSSLARCELMNRVPRTAANVLIRLLHPEEQAVALSRMPLEDVRGVMSVMRSDTRMNLLQDMPSLVTERLIPLMEQTELDAIKFALSFSPNSAGRAMLVNRVSVRPEWTVAETLEHLRERKTDLGHRAAQSSRNLRVQLDKDTGLSLAPDSESDDPNTPPISIASVVGQAGGVFVTDADGLLVGAVSFEALILARPEALLEQVMDPNPLVVTLTDHRERALRLLRSSPSDHFAVAVVNDRGELMGSISLATALQLADAAQMEDMENTASIMPLGDKYSRASALLLYRKRIPWLLLLVVVNLGSSSIIAAFEHTLASNIALAYFLPLLIDSGGNTGAQSGTLVIKALVMNDIALTDWAKVLLKELFVGIMLGVTLGVACFGMGVLRDTIALGWVVSLTMLTVIVFANLLGMGLPFILTLMKLDPTVAASPLITSVLDIAGLAIYFAIATAILL